MTGSRTRALVLLVAAFVGGCAVGAFTYKSLGQSDSVPNGGRRGGPRGRAPQDWMRALKLDSAQVDTINAIWFRNERAMDSLTKSRIGAQQAALWRGIKPAWDSLTTTIRPAIDSLRSKTRTETRAALPDSMRVRYDSIVAAADSSRRRQAEMRDSLGRGDGPDRNGPPGGPGRGGSGRGSGGGPPGG